MITTSRYSGRKSRSLAKILSSIFGISFAARGKKKFVDLIEKARRQGDNRLVLLSESSGEPRFLEFVSVDPEGKWKRIPSVVLLGRIYVMKKPSSIGCVGPQWLLDLFDAREGDNVCHYRNGKLICKDEVGNPVLELDLWVVNLESKS